MLVLATPLDGTRRQGGALPIAIRCMYAPKRLVSTAGVPWGLERGGEGGRVRGRRGERGRSQRFPLPSTATAGPPPLWRGTARTADTEMVGCGPPNGRRVGPSSDQ